MTTPTPYLKQVLKDLDKSLAEGFSRDAKIELLSAYETGLRSSLSECYPDDFSFDKKQLDGVEKIASGFLDAGRYRGNQFGPLETDLAKELLSEIDKRKAKFSKPSWFENLTAALSQYYETFSKGYGS